MSHTAGLRVRVHRGAREVGGSCVEVEADGARLVLDVGRPLWADRDEHVPAPGVPGLTSGDDPSLLGVLVTHAHLDHYGLVDQVHPGVPVYIGEAASRIIEAARYFTGGPPLRVSGVLGDRVPMELGPFSVTPYLVDHSAFDAYALLVDAGGRRLLYTGDLRGHGRKRRLFEEMVAHPPAGVNTLLMEGTQVRPARRVDARSSSAPSEQAVEAAMAATLRDAAGLVVVTASAQNVDRLVTTYGAARRSGRVLLMDLYGVTVANATGRASIPRPGAGFPDLGVWLPPRQRALVRDSGQFERTAAVRDARVYDEQLAAEPARYVIYTGSSSVAGLIRVGALRAGGAVVWSMWSGYLAEPSGARLRQLLAQTEVLLVEHHTSGHASIGDLQRLVSALMPQAVVPIHTEGAEDFARYFAHAQVHDDGEWWAA